MSGMKGAFALGGVLLAIIFVTFVVVDMTSTEPRPVTRTNPTPEARAVRASLVSLGGSPTSFDCNNYRMQLGDELEAKQLARLCRDGGPILDGVISSCLCTGSAPEVASEEDPLLLDSLEDLGYECQTSVVQGVNVTERVGDFNATVCRTRLCADDSCPDLLALQSNLCGKQGQPRYPSATAECVCLNAPPPPPTMCSPGQTLPVTWNETLAGLLTITQTNASLTVNVTTEELCFQQPRVYIGATPAPRHPQFPVLPGMFPTFTWEQEIGVSSEGPARFSLADLNVFSPEWNHPDAPTFECGHELYLEWAALATPRLESGHCPSMGQAASWIPASSDPVAFTYTFCCV